MVREKDLGQTIPQTAQTLGHQEQTVRKYHKGVGADGFAALPDRPIPGRPLTLRRADLDALRHLLDAAAARGETWMTPCLRHWLATTRGERRSTRSIYDHTKAAHFSGQEPLVEQACAA